MAFWAGEYCWQASGELEMVKCKDLPLAGGGIARQELPWFAMNCPAGSLITSVQTRFLELTVHYRCKEMMFIGSCTEWITPNFASTDRAMMEARISCPSPDMGLQSTLASAPAGTMSGAASVSVRYRCCYTGPLVTSIALQRDAKLSWAQSRFNDYNGVYCPQRRDDTGRLQYEQSSSFRPSTTPKGLLAFDAVKGQWCLDWQGRRRRPLGCVDTYVAEPLDGAGLRTDAGGWSTVAVSDFNAELENLGIQTGRPPAFHQQALAPSHVPKRPKPSLLTFTSQIPGLGPAPECKTLVPDWRMVGEGLSKENPCYFVSGETADPAAEEPEVGEGASWTERTDDATDEGDTDAGFSYEKILGCFDRSIKRQLKLNHAIKEFSSNQLIGDTVLGVVRATCAWLASVAVAPVGFGSIVQTGEICQALVDSSQGVEGSVVQWQKDSKADSIYKADSEDCAGDQAAFSRLWCDIHCVKDAVNQGNRALRISLENAVRVLTGNMDRLTEHQSQLMVDQFDALRADLFPNAELPGVELQRFLVSKVRSIQALLFQPLDAAGQDVTGRAVRALSTELSSWTGDGPNVTHLLNKAETVHAAVKLTKQRHGLGRLQALTRNIGRAAVAIQDLARAQSHELGVYNHSSFAWKERQEQLLKSSVDRFEGDALFRDVGSVGASPVLLELDSTWWSLRATLDKYLSSAKRYAQAMGEVASMLQSYTSCSIQYAPVHGSFSHLMKAEKEHRKALDEAWSSAVPMTGLLVSKLVDSNAFVKLSIEDAKAAYELLHSEKQLCNEPGESGAKRAGQVLNQTLQQGLVGQTERQLATLFQELHLLQGRLPPSSDAENADVLQQSALRAQYAIRAARPFHQDFENFFTHNLRKPGSTLLQFCTEFDEKLRRLQAHGVKLPTTVQGKGHKAFVAEEGWGDLDEAFYQEDYGWEDDYEAPTIESWQDDDFGFDQEAGYYQYDNEHEDEEEGFVATSDDSALHEDVEPFTVDFKTYKSQEGVSQDAGQTPVAEGSRKIVLKDWKRIDHALNHTERQLQAMVTSELHAPPRPRLIWEVYAGGFICLLTDKEAFEGVETPYHVLDWKSMKLPRVARSSLAAEAQASSAAADNVEFIVRFWNELFNPQLELKSNLAVTESSLQPVLITDAKALYDTYHRDAFNHGSNDKRTALEVKVTHQQVESFGGRLKWVSSERQYGDGLTKLSARQLLADRLRHGSIKYTWDPTYTAAKKKLQLSWNYLESPGLEQLILANPLEEVRELQQIITMKDRIIRSLGGQQMQGHLIGVKEVVAMKDDIIRRLQSELDEQKRLSRGPESDGQPFTAYVPDHGSPVDRRIADFTNHRRNLVLFSRLQSEDAEDYYLYGQMLVRCCLDEAGAVLVQLCQAGPRRRTWQGLVLPLEDFVRRFEAPTHAQLEQHFRAAFRAAPRGEPVTTISDWSR
ncbi:unnamed protein product [Durusdinium trenchii]|uniref:Uncharacterized protein n=1 Tax=Durusdinium trenchii TaxID=1381693 RepID=A0ABP0N4M0_9DINO